MAIGMKVNYKLIAGQRLATSSTALLNTNRIQGVRTTWRVRIVQLWLAQSGRHARRSVYRPHSAAGMASSVASLSSAVCAPAALQSSFNGRRASATALFAVRRTRAFARLQVSCAAASPETLTKVRDIIAQQLAVEADKIAPDSKFVDLGADSLDTVEIMMALEEKFDITLDEEGAEKIGTVQEAADLIQDQLK